MGIGSFGFSEMAVIFLIALIVFGPRKLPELGRTLGAAMREFRRSLNQIQREIEESDPVRTMRDETRSILGPDTKERSGSGPAAGASRSGPRAGPRPTGPRPRPSEPPPSAEPADVPDGHSSEDRDGPVDESADGPSDTTATTGA
ncbi:MAG: Sec-independent protein translocase subunit TatA/TatB [Gemmatimonadota bacterium]